MNVLLSIKPKYVEKILDGKKKYEFRKQIPKRYDDIDRVYIYSTSPEKKIVGYFTLDEIIEAEPKKLWGECKDYSGIEKDKFFQYYEGREKGFAIKIDEIEEFKEPLNPYTNFENFNAPQTFYYTEQDYVDKRNN